SPDYGIVAGRSTHVGQDGTSLGLKRLLPEVEQELTCRDLIFRTCFFPSAVVARKSALEKAGLFDPTLRSSEDRDMWIRMSAHCKVFVHGERLVRIRRHSSNMSKHADRMKLNIGVVLRKAYAARIVPHSAVLF